MGNPPTIRGSTVSRAAGAEEKAFTMPIGRPSMGSLLDMIMWVVAILYGVLLIAAFYAFAVGVGSLFLLVAFLAVGFTGVAAWVAFVGRKRGWGGDTQSASDGMSETDTPLETLRSRYARGELTDAQYERKLERLLEADTLEHVEDRSAQREQESERE